MKGIIIITIGCLVYFPSFGQWNDDFSDGNFNVNPLWEGNLSNFVVETGVLRLSAPAVSATSYLSTASDISLEATWSFWAKLDFNPSSSNYMKVFLMADVSDLTAVNNGYYVKIGGTPDEISLYKISNGTETLLIDGSDSRVSLSTVDIQIVVIRDVNGEWTIKSKLLGEMDFVLEATANDLEIQESTYFGMMCTYTSTRSTKMYLDDISVMGSPFVDVYPPMLVSYSTPSASQIQLDFDEPMDPVELEKTIHYLLNDSASPNTAYMVNEQIVLLEFDNGLDNINSLSISALPDVAMNPMDTTLQVLFVDPSAHVAGELVINELMPDPNPPEDLPAYEFVELLNLSDRIIDLSNWKLTDASTISTLPEYLIYPDSLVILCPKAADSLFASYGAVIGLSTWPSLNNSGDSIRLLDDSDAVIDSVFYTSDWYKDELKSSGGWSLEQINPQTKCNGEYNWAASIDAKGGTPGQVNSLFDKIGDQTLPVIEEAIVKDRKVELVFSEPLVANVYTVTILPDGIQSGFQLTTPTNYAMFEIVEELDATKPYTVKVALEDCSGNTNVAEDELVVVGQPVLGEVAFNELLPDPTPPKSLPEYEYIEITNHSKKIFDLSGWKLRVNDRETMLSTTLLYPDAMLILCPNEAEPYFQQYESTLGLSNWLTLTNTGAHIELWDDKDQLVDSLTYTIDWYNDGSKDNGGWSLELINSESKCKGSYNWSASINEAGGTPGQPNSLFLDTSDQQSPQVVGALLENDSLKLWLSEPTVQGTYQAVIFPDQQVAEYIIEEPRQFLITKLNESIPMDKRFTVELNLEDCKGNNAVSSVQGTPISQPKNGDLVINELLFNPYTADSDFVELYNVSPYYFNLQGYSIGNETSYKTIRDSIFIFEPNKYLTLSEDTYFLADQYHAPESNLVFADLPTMPNDEGIVVIRDCKGTAVDSVFYSEDYHFIMLADPEGVSLERVSAIGSSLSPDNWKSAAETVDFATPGYANSQSSSAIAKGVISVSPQVITPNNDGQNDYCQITYGLTGSDKVISVHIYNLAWQLVKTIANNVLVSPQGFFTWDGTNNQGGYLPTAHYVLISEIIDSDGRTQRYMNKVVVANGF